MDTEMDCSDSGDGHQPTHGHHMTNRSGRNVNLGFGGLSSSQSAAPIDPSGPPYSTQSLSRRLAPNSIGLQMTPTTKMLLNQRRSSSGIFITSMFGSRFRHLQKLHSEAFLGLNSICLPGLPMGAVFRSSLPATPVATPIHREAFQQFTEQALRDRLCKTPSPRKNRGFLSTLAAGGGDHPMDRSVSPAYSQMSDVQPMDIASPIDEPVLEDPIREESPNGLSTGYGGGGGHHYYGRTDRMNRTPTDVTEPTKPPDEWSNRWE